MIHRRSLLTGLICAPAVILTPGLLMPIKPFGYDQSWWDEEVAAMERARDLAARVQHAEWKRRRMWRDQHGNLVSADEISERFIAAWNRLATT